MAELDNGAGLIADVSYSSPAWKMPTYWEFRIWCDKGLLTYSYFDSKVRVYDNGGMNGVREYDGIPVEYNYLDEFYFEIQNGSRKFTDSVLNSSESTLKVQKAAD